MGTKKPQPDLIIRMVSPGLRPWIVPMRSLTRTLQAVQSLMEAELGEWHEPDEDDESIEKVDTKEEGEGDSFLYLLDVVYKSATYPVGTRDSERALRVLNNTGEAIENPESAKWSPGLLYPVRTLSEVAQALGCEIEFRLPGTGRGLGDVIAKIGPATYDQISQAAFVCGDTSIYGKIERVGGATRMRCGLRVPEQPNRMIICSVTNQDLARQLGQYLYQHLVVSGKATWYRRDWMLCGMDIVSFEPPKAGSVIHALDKVHDAGGHAWDRFDNPRGYLMGQRG